MDFGKFDARATFPLSQIARHKVAQAFVVYFVEWLVVQLQSFDRGSANE